MIIFHEGLPRSGKSYEACVTRIIPALKSGRKVFAHIDGLNHQQFADLLDLPLQEVKRLLVPVSAADVPRIYEVVADDSLVIIDELQDYFPSGKSALPDGITKFVTQHGHRGIDIICMGQDHRDCHNLWKRRIDQMYSFVKLDAIGLESRYTWKSYKQREGKFVQLSSGTNSYDPKYFGLYKSHVDTAMNKANYKDDRANILKTKAIKFGVPAFALAVVLALVYIWRFFHPEPQAIAATKPPAVAAASAPKTVPGLKSQSAQAPASVPISPEDLHPQRYVASIIDRYKPRLAALVQGKNKIIARVEFLDDSLHVKETLDLPGLVALGWRYAVQDYGLVLTKGERRVVVTAWPLEIAARTSGPVLNKL